VSSLIHAATMVAAGVFLLVRIEPLFNETVLMVIASIGLFTAFMAATIALTQNDIKRVLAFSTVSQLGFMMLAIGTGDSAAAIFHLVTHAFFKCLLFLGAGAVIHEMHHLKEKTQYSFDEQDMRNMGRFAKWMPITAIVFVLASIALAGLPFSSGFLSKDAVLLSVFEWANSKGGAAWLFPVVISLTSWFTVFYIFRVIFKVFFGEFRLPQLLKADLGARPLHDPNNYMKIPVIILAVFCIAFVFALNPFSLEASWIYSSFNLNDHQDSVFHLLIPVYINVLSFVLIFATYKVYASNKVVLNLEKTWLYKFSFNQWYFNELYDTLFVKTTVWLSRAWYWFDRTIIDGLVNFSGTLALWFSKLSDWIDKNVIDGLVNFSAVVVERLGIWFRAVHNGKFQHYIIWMLLVFLSYFIFQMI
ncbi:NADH-quinone oxidoreductase subunit L, partial [Pseudoxanthomonas sp. SGD-10]